MSEKVEQLNSILKHPCSVIVAGPSKCGKTTLVQKLLENNECVFDLPPQRIYYCYSRWQDIFITLKSVKPSIEFIINANYIIILNNPRDRSQFTYLARQIEPGNTNYLNECYYDAVESKEYGYLFLDFTQTTNRILRVQSDFCFKDPNSIKRVIYFPKEN